jgi:hypothetical protein
MPTIKNFSMRIYAATSEADVLLQNFAFDAN